MDFDARPQEAAGAEGVGMAQTGRTIPDVTLVSLIRAGHHSAFSTVYERHHREILGICRRMLADEAEAEDAVQNVFLAAYLNIVGSAKPIALRPWLFAIARNRCLTVLRSRREQPVADVDEPTGEGLSTTVLRRQDLRDTLHDLRGLPREQRTALVLAELEAMSHEQIAGVLGVPRAKVKALVFQARASLIATREARHTDCADIRSELATQRGADLRRGHLRRHLRECSGCRAFRRG